MRVAKKSAAQEKNVRQLDIFQLLLIAKNIWQDTFLWSSLTNLQITILRNVLETDIKFGKKFPALNIFPKLFMWCKKTKESSRLLPDTVRPKIFPNLDLYSRISLTRKSASDSSREQQHHQKWLWRFSKVLPAFHTSFLPHFFTMHASSLRAAKLQPFAPLSSGSGAEKQDEGGRDKLASKCFTH